MIDTLKICATGIICAVLCVIMRAYNTSFLIPSKIAGIIVVYSLIIVFLSPLIQYFTSIIGNIISIDNLKLMLKSISIAYITQITSDVCRDCGEQNLATGIDTVGKIEIIILALPLVDDIIKISEELALW